MGEITLSIHEGSIFPEIVSLVLTSTCWPNTVMTGEVHEHRRSICLVSVGLHGVYLLLQLFCVLIFILCLSCQDFIREMRKSTHRLRVADYYCLVSLL